MSEQVLWKQMKQLWRKDLRMWRVENRAGVGLPDVHFLCPVSGASGWIELKYQKTKGTPVPLREAQKGFLHQYTLDGGNAFVIVRAGGSSGIYCFDGCMAFKIASRPLSESIEKQYFIQPDSSQYRSEMFWSYALEKVKGMRPRFDE